MAGRSNALGAALTLALALGTDGCGPPPTLVSQTPIPVALDGGAPLAFGTVNGTAPYAMLIDTGTPLTAVAGQAPTVRTAQATVRLLDDRQIPRAEFQQVPVLATPLGSITAHDPAAPGGPLLGGVLGGDLLQQFQLVIDYQSSSISLLPPEVGCSCALADACEAVFPFTLAGGGVYQLGDQVFTYPATRVTVDACLQPVVDPQSQGLCCDDGAKLPMGFTADGAPGVDVRLLVATGFPGVLLGASAYDRLCDAATRFLGVPAASCPSSSVLLAQAPPMVIDFPDPGLQVTRAAQLQLGQIGQTASTNIPLAALALVGREGLLSACGELARSRRLRAHPPEVSDCDSPTTPAADQLTCLQNLQSSGNDVCQNPNRCNDRDQPAAAYIELDEPVPVWIVDSTTNILARAINPDVQPQLSDVEGIIGTALLERLTTRIDYPNHRVIAHCAAGVAGCTTYPRYACPGGQAQADDCDPDQAALCNPPSSLRPGGAACLPAPNGVPVARPDGLGCAPVDLAMSIADGASGD